MRRPFPMILTAALIVAGFARAQEPNKQEAPAKTTRATESKESKPINIYRVDYAVHELENGKRSKTRSYTLMVEPDNKARFSVGSNIPLAMGEKGLPLQYHRIGMNIDCVVQERDPYVLIKTMMEMSGVASGELTSAASSAPVLRQFSLTDDAKVILGKPTLVGAIDDVTANRRYEIEVTVEKIK